MDTNAYYLIGLVVLVLTVIAFFVVFRGEGTFRLITKLFRLEAKGKNPPPPSSVPAGVRISGESGRNTIASSTSQGGVEVNVKAKGSIDASHDPSQSPPKT